jgi:uncharacterized Fe-S cluster-containing radical SAM superfamily protein
MTIDTEILSSRYRKASVDLKNKQLLITNFLGTEQEQDMTEPPNCQGFGRIRHFRKQTNNIWPSNPLPIDPACHALSLSPQNVLRAQVFQNAACNWRCWYCYVPFNLLAADPKYAAFLSPATLVDLYLAQPAPPLVIDLTGGQPDLTPEWVPWIMAELRVRGLEHKTYLWSDDNLSSDFFWRFLSEEDLALIASYANYGRVCCFKGFDSESFAFNTRAEPELFEQQFQLMGRLLSLRIDLYAYATFTSLSSQGLEGKMRLFIDRLQKLNEVLPLRTIPLQIQPFSSNKSRLDPESQARAIETQQLAVEIWNRELKSRFSFEQRSCPITSVFLYGDTRV